MVAVARRTYPDLQFDEGSMAALDLKNDSVGGIVGWYSIIHTPQELSPVVFAEFHRCWLRAATCYSRSRSATNVYT
jgi:hypothetical protein